MLRRSPLKAKRDKPRRNEGRVSHARMKPKAKVAANAVEQAHIDRLMEMGCLICGRPARNHHLMKCPGKVRRRDHRFIAPLCDDHHQGDEGVHGLGSEAAFEERWKFVERYGMTLAQWAINEWGRTIRPSAPTMSQ